MTFKDGPEENKQPRFPWMLMNQSIPAAMILVCHLGRAPYVILHV